MKTSVGCFIVNNKNKILIGHPTWSSDGKGFWSIPKGKMDPGETVAETLEREVMEESGYSIRMLMLTDTTIREVGVEVYKHKKKRLHAFAAFVMRNLNQEPKCTSFFDKKDKDGNPLPEFDGFAWVSFDEAVEKLHYTQSNLLTKHKKLFQTRGAQDGE